MSVLAMILDMTPKEQGTNAKNQQVGLYQTKASAQQKKPSTK